MDKLPSKKTRQYAIWAHMKARCQNQNSKDFPRWGGRGIKVCAKWQTFKGFWEDMSNGYRDSLQLERIDNNGNYEPSNCKWATPKEQANNRRNSVMIRIGGITKTLAQWVDETDLKYRTVWMRICRGWDAKKALSTPTGRKV